MIGILERVCSGAEFRVAQNGREAVEEYRSFAADNKRFHAIIMDIIMPKMDGYAATKSIR
jgi:CheY-like chemotaxis protein